MDVKKPGNRPVGLARLRQTRVIPEPVLKRLKHNELRWNAGLQKGPLIAER